MAIVVNSESLGLQIKIGIVVSYFLAPHHYIVPQQLSYFHIIIGKSGLEETSGHHLVQPSVENRLYKASSSQVLNISRKGKSTISLGNLFQCLIVLAVNTFFLYLDRTSEATCACCLLPCHSVSHEESTSIFSIIIFYLLGDRDYIPPEPSLLEAEQTQFLLISSVCFPTF